MRYMALRLHLLPLLERMRDRGRRGDAAGLADTQLAPKGVVHVIAQGLSPTVDDEDEDEEEAPEDEDEEEEEVTLWSQAPIQLRCAKVSQYKGEVEGSKPTVVTSPGGGPVEVVAGSVTVTCGGAVTVLRGSKGKVTAERVMLMQQQGSDMEDDADEDSVTIIVTDAGGKREQRKVA